MSGWTALNFIDVEGIASSGIAGAAERKSSIAGAITSKSASLANPGKAAGRVYRPSATRSPSEERVRREIRSRFPHGPGNAWSPPALADSIVLDECTVRAWRSDSGLPAETAACRTVVFLEPAASGAATVVTDLLRSGLLGTRQHRIEMKPRNPRADKDMPFPLRSAGMNGIIENRRHEPAVARLIGNIDQDLAAACPAE